MAISRTTGPRSNTPRTVGVGFNAEAFYLNLVRADVIQNFETAYRSGQSAISRTDFVKTQMGRITALYSSYATALNNLSQETVGTNIESVLASASTVGASVAPPPFGTLLQGLSLLLTIGGQSKQQAELDILNAKGAYLKTVLGALQDAYTGYQAELTSTLVKKLAIIGVSALVALLTKKHNGNND